MDMAKTGSLCCICGAVLIAEDSVPILKDSTDLKIKIKDTLSLNIPDDNNDIYHICMICHKKVIHFYKFRQDILTYQKDLDNASLLKPNFDLVQNIERTKNFIKNYNDAVYSCPNCDVDLMILIVSNPQGSEYNFQISLVLVDSHDGHSTKNNLDESHANVKSIDNIKVEDDDTAIDKEHIESITQMEQVTIKEEGQIVEQRLDHVKVSVDPTHTLNLITPSIVSYNSIYLNNAVQVESGPMKWADNGNIVSTHNRNEENDETDAGKTKIMCELCGARYISLMKYEFHVERHKLGDMDKYKCPLCDKETSTENLLWDHYYHNHKSSQRFACMTCGKLFAKRSRLRGHQKWHKHSGEKEVHIEMSNNNIDCGEDRQPIRTEIEVLTSANCNFCGTLVHDLNPEAINDLVTCTSCEDTTLSLMVDGDKAKPILPRQYHCSKCPKHFVRRERLEFHEMRHNENMNEYVCSTCGKEFRAENSLYEHYIFVHKGARPHICELCGKSFQLKARLKEHHRTHTGERPYQCDICGQRCMTSNALKLHRKIHFSYNRYTCNICKKSFSKKQNMNEHLEKHWKTDRTVSLPRVFTCPVCSDNFPTYRMLKYHMIDVHKVNEQDPLLVNQKPWYECKQCHEKFKHQMSLKAHREKEHEGKTSLRYDCNECGVSYRIKQLLVNHIKCKHTTEKRYKCAQCEKGFNDSKSLYNHILLHTGKKPYACEYCGMAFRRKDSRDQHQRKHTGEQPFQCPDCGEAFATYNNRAKHRKQKHGEQFECSDCGEKCNGEEEIRVHLNKHLGEKLRQLENIKEEVDEAVIT